MTPIRNKIIISLIILIFCLPLIGADYITPHSEHTSITTRISFSYRIIAVNYDLANRLRENIYELSINVKYGYDKNSRLTSLRDDKNNITQYQYDAVNRRKLEKLPDNSTKQYLFNQYGVLDGMIDNNQSGISYTYDTGLRMTQKDIYPGTGVQGTTQEVFTYDGIGRMTQATNYDGATQISQVSMQYDSLGNLLTETQQIGGQSVKSVASVYDIMSFRTGLTYPSGTKTVNFEPDDLNRIERITQNAQLIAQYTYAGPGRVTGRSYYNGTSLSVTYDDGRRAITYTHGTTIGGFEYYFDNEDNKKYEKRSFGAKGDAFKYDAIYRLTGVKYGVPNTDLTPSTPYENYLTYDSKEEFELDGVGNRIRVIDGITTTYTTNNLNQYTQISSTNLTYDLNGNLTDDGVNTYVYDYANQLLRVTRKSDSRILGEYKYDTLGRRIYKTAWSDQAESYTETYFYYDGVRCIEERNSGDNVIATYTFGKRIDEVLTSDYPVESYQHPIIGTFYYHTNSLGSVYATTDSSGNVFERYRYEAYGKVIYLDSNNNPLTQSNIGNNILFTGREYDTETGLYYYRARYYSPILGRFMQRDSAQDDIFFNLYAYVLNNPVRWVDPTGLYTRPLNDLEKGLANQNIAEVKRLTKCREDADRFKNLSNELQKKIDSGNIYIDSETPGYAHAMAGQGKTRLSPDLFFQGNVGELCATLFHEEVHHEQFAESLKDIRSGLAYEIQLIGGIFYTYAQRPLEKPAIQLAKIIKDFKLGEAEWRSPEQFKELVELHERKMEEEKAEREEQERREIERRSQGQKLPNGSTDQGSYIETPDGQKIWK